MASSVFWVGFGSGVEADGGGACVLLCDFRGGGGGVNHSRSHYNYYFLARQDVE